MNLLIHYFKSIPKNLIQLIINKSNNKMNNFINIFKPFFEEAPTPRKRNQTQQLNFNGLTKLTNEELFNLINEMTKQNEQEFIQNIKLTIEETLVLVHKNIMILENTFLPILFSRKVNINFCLILKLLDYLKIIEDLKRLQEDIQMKLNTNDPDTPLFMSKQLYKTVTNELEVYHQHDFKNIIVSFELNGEKAIYTLNEEPIIQPPSPNTDEKFLQHIELLEMKLVEYDEILRQKNKELKQRENEYEKEIQQVNESHQKRHEKDTKEIINLRDQKVKLNEMITTQQKIIAGIKEKQFMMDYDLVKNEYPYIVSIDHKTFNFSRTIVFKVDFENINDKEHLQLPIYKLMKSIEQNEIRKVTFEIDRNKIKSTRSNYSKVYLIEFKNEGTEITETLKYDVRIYLKHYFNESESPSDDFDDDADEYNTSDDSEETVNNDNQMNENNDENINEIRDIDLVIPEQLNQNINTQNQIETILIDLKDVMTGCEYQITLNNQQFSISIPASIENNSILQINEYLSLLVKYKEDGVYKRIDNDLHAYFIYNKEFENQIVQPTYIYGNLLENQIQLIDNKEYSFDGYGFVNHSSGERGKYIVHISLCD